MILDRDSVELAVLIVGQVATAGAIYGAIRSDIRHMRNDLERHEHQFDRLQTRIDSLKGTQ